MSKLWYSPIRLVTIKLFRWEGIFLKWAGLKICHRYGPVTATFWFISPDFLRLKNLGMAANGALVDTFQKLVKGVKTWTFASYFVDFLHI